MPDEKKTLTPSKVFLFGTIIKNPILVQVIGLCPAVAASSSLTVALLLSFVTTILLIVCEVLASALLKPLPSWFRVAVYMITGLLFICPLMYILDEAGFSVVSDAGVYLPLMAANSVVALRCEKFAVKRSVFLSFYDAVATGIGVSSVLMLSGTIRELLGFGTVAGKAVFESAPVPALTMPFGGFVVLGFLAAFLKKFISTFLSGYSYDMPFRIKRTRRRRPGRTSEQPVLIEPTSSGEPLPLGQSTVLSSPAIEPDAASDPSLSGGAVRFQIHEAPKESGKESFADVFYNSMSEDLFAREEAFDDIAAEVKTEKHGGGQFTVGTETSPSANSDIVKPARDEAERVVIPVDLDLLEEEEINRALKKDSEGGKDG